MRSVRCAPVGRSLAARTRGGEGGGEGEGEPMISFEQTLQHGAIRPVPGAFTAWRRRTCVGRTHLVSTEEERSPSHLWVVGAGGELLWPGSRSSTPGFLFWHGKLLKARDVLGLWRRGMRYGPLDQCNLFTPQRWKKSEKWGPRAPALPNWDQYIAHGAGGGLWRLRLPTGKLVLHGSPVSASITKQNSTGGDILIW